MTKSKENQKSELQFRNLLPVYPVTITSPYQHPAKMESIGQKNCYRMCLAITTILKGWNQLAGKIATDRVYPATITILKGWNQSAQGCEERATLGLAPGTPTTLKGLYQSVRPIKTHRLRFSNSFARIK